MGGHGPQDRRIQFMTGYGAAVLPQSDLGPGHPIDLHADAAWNRALGQYMMTSWCFGGGVGRLRLHLSDDAVVFEPPILIDEEPGQWMPYSTFLASEQDRKTDDMNAVGAEFFLLINHKSATNYSFNSLWRRKMVGRGCCAPTRPGPCRGGQRSSRRKPMREIARPRVSTPRLLMTVQPDMDCQGPRSRTEDLGFDVGFEDLPKGTLRQLRPEYFQMFDRLTGILVAHGIAPVYQPVFHGYGWKGRRGAGNVVSAEDYARYCRYLVARYVARPAIWLVGGDGPATGPAIIAQLDRAGQTIEEWDAYRQPTGIHYSPHALFRTHQDKTWLDFQWCQTGHNGEHVPERVADMWRNTPVKAVANGEPTYENIGQTGRGAGWWQGHEAWCNLTAGGTMGLVYGAGSLWQWRLHANEPDHADWCTAPGAGWREALDFEGSRYPGIAAKIFDGLPFAEMQPNWTYTYGRRGLAVPGKLFVLYLPEGGGTGITSLEVPRAYRIYDPRTGQEVGKGRLPDQAPIQFNSGSSGEPRVVVFVAEGGASR